MKLPSPSITPRNIQLGVQIKRCPWKCRCISIKRLLGEVAYMPLVRKNAYTLPREDTTRYLRTTHMKVDGKPSVQSGSPEAETIGPAQSTVRTEVRIQKGTIKSESSSVIEDSRNDNPVAAEKVGLKPPFGGRQNDGNH